MTDSANRIERRRHRRVELAASAVVFQEGVPIGRYVVQSLSAGGALLAGPHDVSDRGALRVVLALPDRSPVAVDAHLVRRARGAGGTMALAVELSPRSTRVEDAIHDAVLQALVRADRVERPGVLVVEDSEPLRQRLDADLQQLGRRVLQASTPLEAVHVLEDPDENIDTVVVDLCVGEADGVELLEFVAREYPHLRRVVLQGPVRLSRHAAGHIEQRVHGLLTDPWDPASLQQTLRAEPRV